MKEFEQLQDLAQWITAIGVDLSQWETGDSKTIENLWTEYVSGEIVFQNDPPQRVVRVVQIIIGRDGQILVETAQEFADGQRRFRNRPPSEKIKPGESIHEAVLRCLQEELGLNPDQISIAETSYEQKETILESPSYPGLMTHYILHRIDAQAVGLPVEEFWRENATAVQGDPVRRHLWAWVARE
jgi:ADP-ribose pyrophosphatase YjhB (NUDIX family)